MKPLRLPVSILTAAHHWSVASQARARRNAMIALTSLAQRRAEREEVDALWAEASGQSVEQAVAVPHRRTADE